MEEGEEEEEDERSEQSQIEDKTHTHTVFLHRRCFFFRGHFSGVQDEFDVDNDGHHQEEHSTSLWQERHTAIQLKKKHT